MSSRLTSSLSIKLLHFSAKIFQGQNLKVIHIKSKKEVKYLYLGMGAFTVKKSCLRTPHDSLPLFPTHQRYLTTLSTCEDKQ